MEFKFDQLAPAIQQLLNKIQAMPTVAAIEQMQQNVTQLLSAVSSLESRVFPDNYTPTPSQIMRKDPDSGVTYPVIHPDIAAKPMLQSYKLGDMQVFEALVTNGDTTKIPANALIIYAYGFTDESGEPLLASKREGVWVLTTIEDGPAPKSVIVRFAVLNEE